MQTRPARAAGYSAHSLEAEPNAPTQPVWATRRRSGTPWAWKGGPGRCRAARRWKKKSVWRRLPGRRIATLQSTHSWVKCLASGLHPPGNEFRQHGANTAEGSGVEPEEPTPASSCAASTPIVIWRLCRPPLPTLLPVWDVQHGNGVSHTGSRRGPVSSHLRGPSRQRGSTDSQIWRR